MIAKQTWGDKCLSGGWESTQVRQEPGEGELLLLLLPACGASTVEEEEFSRLHWHCNVSEDSCISLTVWMDLCTAPAGKYLKQGYSLICRWLRQIKRIIYWTSLLYFRFLCIADICACLSVAMWERWESVAAHGHGGWRWGWTRRQCVDAQPAHGMICNSARERIACSKIEKEAS